MVLLQRTDLPEQSTIKEWQLQKKTKSKPAFKSVGKKRFNACGLIFMTSLVYQLELQFFETFLSSEGKNYGAW